LESITGSRSIAKEVVPEREDNPQLSGKHPAEDEDDEQREKAHYASYNKLMD